MGYWVICQETERRPGEGMICWVTVKDPGGQAYLSQAKYQNGKWFLETNTGSFAEEAFEGWDLEDGKIRVDAWWQEEMPRKPIIVERKIPYKFPEFETDPATGLNKKINFHEKQESEMEAAGFQKTTYWFQSKSLGHGISLNIKVGINGHGNILVLDDDFGQPYDYQSMLMKNRNHRVHLKSWEKLRT